MYGVESAQIKAYQQTKIDFSTINFNKQPAISLGQTQGGAPKGDMVNIQNKFAQMAEQLMAKVDQIHGDGQAGARMETMRSVSMEISARFSMSGRIEQYSGQNGPNGEAIGAYREASYSYEENYRMEYSKTEAENIVAAHAGAMNGDAFGPEATADRIAQFAASFFPMFAADHPEMSHEEQVEAYREMVEGAIDEGFKEAMAILGELPDEVSQGIDETRSLVTEKLDAFFNHLLGDGAEEGKQAAQNGGWKEYISNFFNSLKESEDTTVA